MYVFAVECYVIRLEFQFLSTETESEKTGLAVVFAQSATYIHNFYAKSPLLVLLLLLGRS